jgi:two-component system, response regulator PdtaR
MGVKVLIVEDEFLIALELEDILLAAGHDVVGVVCDRNSLSQIDEPPEVALVDLNLRDGPSGQSIALELARRHGTAIFYITANPDQIVEPASTALGVVQKPFSPHAIMTAVEIASGRDSALPPQGMSLFVRAAR